MLYDDTIAAVATPPGEGGIGIVRLSGPDALPIARGIFVPARPGPLRSYRLRYGYVTDPATGVRVDQAMLAYMRAPHSYTRQDVVEISCHGGALPVQRTLSLALAAGARLARPGEFTLRAFLSGRIDLSQAEATLDVIRAQTDTALQIAQAQLDGWLQRRIHSLRATLMEALAYLTATLDFPEDDVEPQAVAAGLHQCLAEIEQLCRSAGQGMVFRQGARVVLVGRPNVGKSSLLNALLRSERAIVTPIPGTTRDTIEEIANLGGIPVVLVDTAGITETADLVERLGVERSRQAIMSADLALLVLDGSMPPTADDGALAELTYTRPTVLVANKLDTWAAEPTGQPAFAAFMAAHPRLHGIVATSAVTGAGLEELATRIASTLLGANPLTDVYMVSNPRHHDLLTRAAEHLRGACDGIAGGLPADIAAIELTSTLNALGELTGETVGDDLLDLIFSRFCIGK